MLDANPLDLEEKQVDNRPMTLTSWDGTKTLPVDLKLAADASPFIKRIVDADKDATDLRVTLLQPAALPKLVDYIQHCPDSKAPLILVAADMENVNSFDAKFIDVCASEHQLYAVIMAAHVLEMAPLENLALAKLACEIKDKSLRDVAATLLALSGPRAILWHAAAARTCLCLPLSLAHTLTFTLSYRHTHTHTLSLSLCLLCTL